MLLVWVVGAQGQGIPVGSQVSTTPGAAPTNLGNALLLESARAGFNEKDVKIAGTPYASDDYVDGEVYSGTNKSNLVPMRYHIVNDVIEFKQGNLVYWLGPSPKIRIVKMGELTLTAEPFVTGDETKFAFFALLDTGKVSLMARMSVVYIEGKPAMALESSSTPPKYQRKPDDYYIKVEDGMLNEVKNLKKMIAMFPDKHEELQKFAKQEKISARKAEGLTTLVRYYNSL